MTVPARDHFDKVFLQLQKYGLLLLSGPHFPSVASSIAKKRKGSWWSYPEANTIFAVNEMLEGHPDVLIVKLISGKVTFVHRMLWARVYSIGVAREAWQMKRLSSSARTLLKKVDDEGKIETAMLGKKFNSKPGDAVRELELYLLIHSKQIHTSSGAHAKILQTWEEWAGSVAFRARATNSPAARRALEERLRAINENYPNKYVRFPWPSV